MWSQSEEDSLAAFTRARICFLEIGWIVMNSKIHSLILAAGFSFMVSTSSMPAQAALEFPAASPSCTIKQRVGLTDVEITYSRPAVKSREIFGNVVPYGKVWRTGANAATKLVFSTPVKLNGNDVPAGTYALMTIPDKDEWTIIINKGSEQWGAYKYDEKSDVVRFKAKPVKMSWKLENFTIEFNPVTETSASLNLAWDEVKVPIEMKVDYVEKLHAEIEKVMASDDAKKPYFQAAAFYFNNNFDLKKALEWVDKAIAERDMFFMVHLKAQILAKQGDKAGAIAAANHSKELALKADDGAYVRLNDELLKKLQ